MEDYKLTAVKYYLDNETSYKNVCNIFKCSERSLKRWIIRYRKDKYIKRYINLFYYSSYIINNYLFFIILYYI